MIGDKKQYPRKAFSVLVSFGVMAALLILPVWHVYAPGAQADASTLPPVEVTITEGNIEIPSTVEAGAVTFNITNNGSEAHGFALSGGIEESLDGEIPPGETETLEVELEAGTYTVYCPVEEHQETAELTVGG